MIPLELGCMLDEEQLKAVILQTRLDAAKARFEGRERKAKHLEACALDFERTLRVYYDETA